MPINSTGDLKTCNISSSLTMQPLPLGVIPGATVLVRGGRWRLDGVLAHGDCRELHLWGGSPPARRVLLWPFDRPVAADRKPRVVSVRLWAWAAAVGAAIAGEVDPLTPRAIAGAVRILPYQLAPAVAMAGGALRLLLADEVGLGKTIQAGWIVADLLAREPAARVLIAVPAGLKRQWAAELSHAFDIAANTVDARWLRTIVADIPADVGPWAAPGVYLGSLDFLKRADVAASLDAQVWDLLVVDEAHTATSPTDRHAALAAVAARARRVVTITATPYSGDPASFASMTSLGAMPKSTPTVMFRRSREDVGDPRRRRHYFAGVRISRAEARLQRLLERYSGLVWRHAPADVEGARLAVTLLRKRALSSPAAAARSLRRRLELLLARAEPYVPRQLLLFDEGDDPGDEPPEAALAAPGLADLESEHRWLIALTDAADEASGMDSKERYLRRLVERTGAEPVIVFTEYRDTLLRLASSLPPSLHLHGGLTASERAAVQARFNATGGLLLATDAAAEGLNLQRRCRIVVNYELPWNPARLEQRIGRVDRIGQERSVHAITLVARDTAEDLVIANLARRLARVVATLGEKDRLGAFLTDARTARLVIAGPADEPEAAADPSPVVKHQPAVGVDAHIAADRLSMRRRLRSRGLLASASQKEDPAVFVSAVRASRHLTAGFVVAVQCTARTEDGDVIGTRVILLHWACDVVRPPTPGAARSIASQTIASAPAIAEMVPEVSHWLAALTQVHERSIESRLARETAMHERRAANVLIQPGLFDRRALRTAEDLSDRERGIHAEHGRQVAELDRARRLNLSCHPVAVLIVWR
jgi:superfamily II DNA or RNA helicase